MWSSVNRVSSRKCTISMLTAEGFLCEGSDGSESRESHIMTCCNVCRPLPTAVCRNKPTFQVPPDICLTMLHEPKRSVKQRVTKRTRLCGMSDYTVPERKQRLGILLVLSRRSRREGTKRVIGTPLKYFREQIRSDVQTAIVFHWMMRLSTEHVHT